MPQDTAALDRRATLRLPIGVEGLAFTHLFGHDAISQCFAFTLGFASRDTNIDPLALLGKRASLEAEGGERPRWLDGFVAAFRMTRIEPGIAHYEADLRPWLWFLGHRRDCRIFQNKSVIEIVEEVFSAYPEADVEKRLQGSYPSREYCVQYDETDLAFVQRLLEHEGIFYFFEYGDGAHTLVLADAMGVLAAAPGYETIPFHFEPEAGRRDREHIHDWAPSRAVRPGAYAHTDYDFVKPAADLMALSALPFGHDQAEGEQYSHPGAHLELDRGDAIAAVRREELQTGHALVTASGTVRGLASGIVFTLDGFPREEENVEHLVLRADYRMDDPAYRAGAGGGSDRFGVTLTLAPTSLPYRPPRTTPRPVMRGPQTATVVGPGGEEIFTDEYARVKVQFHWDRLGGRNENSSCFVRVSQTWAGAGWGFIQIPRIGQEVVVDFIEGDPDKPLITGRVYNGAQTPPYGLPGAATQSGWKSNSTPGGGGWNELRFEDKAGAEEVYFQAQKDHTLLVKNDRAKLVQHDQSDRIDNNARHSVGVDLDEDVGNNKTTSVGVDRTVTIGSNDTESVGVNRSLSVGADETISIGASSTETVGLNHTQTVTAAQTVTVGAARVDTVGAAEARTVGAAQVNTIGGLRQVSVGLVQSHTIGGSDSWSIGAGQTVNITAAQSLTIGAGRTTSVTADDATDVGGARSLKIGKGSVVEIAEDGLIKVGKNLVMDAGETIVLKCGSASITMKKDGTITIDGKDVSVNASGKINGKASGDVTLKGAKILQN
jgi:type VI secretion system secreted protein VgrG